MFRARALAEPRRGGPRSQGAVHGWAHLPAVPQGGGSVHLVSGSYHFVSLSHPRHKCFVSLALPGLGSEGRSSPLTCCEADRVGSAPHPEGSR